MRVCPIVRCVLLLLFIFLLSSPPAPTSSPPACAPMPSTSTSVHTFCSRPSSVSSHLLLLLRCAFWFPGDQLATVWAGARQELWCAALPVSCTRERTESEGKEGKNGQSVGEDYLQGRDIRDGYLLILVAAALWVCRSQTRVSAMRHFRYLKP